jgi:hypothetical protein
MRHRHLVHDSFTLAAAYLQRIVPDAVLVGGTASALHAKHRISLDADHVLTDLRQRFDAVLADLESVAGWRTARVQRSVQILGSLDGIMTGVRQLIRTDPLDTQTIAWRGQTIRLPTPAPRRGCAPWTCSTCNRARSRRPSSSSSSSRSPCRSTWRSSDWASTGVW